MILKRLVVVVCALLATVGSVPCKGQDKPSGFFTSWERPCPRYACATAVMAYSSSHGFVGLVAGFPHRFRPPDRTGGNRILEL